MHYAFYLFIFTIYIHYHQWQKALISKQKQPRTTEKASFLVNLTFIRIILKFTHYDESQNMKAPVFK